MRKKGEERAKNCDEGARRKSGKTKLKSGAA